MRVNLRLYSSTGGLADENLTELEVPVCPMPGDLIHLQNGDEKGIYEVRYRSFYSMEMLSSLYAPTQMISVVVEKRA